MLPEGPKDESTSFGSFEFNEQFDEEVLQTKFVVINRAPAMTVWATVVAERLGFKREEALSIASAYTEMNAISKGVSLGIFEKRRADGVELAKGETQPYVDFMGRRMYVSLLIHISNPARSIRNAYSKYTVPRSTDRYTRPSPAGSGVRY